LLASASFVVANLTTCAFVDELAIDALIAVKSVVWTMIARIAPSIASLLVTAPLVVCYACIPILAVALPIISTAIAPHPNIARVFATRLASIWIARGDVEVFDPARVIIPSIVISLCLIAMSSSRVRTTCVRA